MIRFDRFSKRFGAQRAVEELSFAVEAGEVVALLGPNGSGKTTSLKAAAGLLAPTSGEVWVGRPERRALEPNARNALSFLPQRVSFPESLTGREVVDFYRRLRGVQAERVGKVLTFASLNGASDRAVATYSGGMVQRLGLAVAVLPDTPLLLLDEPTAALDPSGLTAFYELVDERKRVGKSVLFTSHQLGDVERVADRFAILVEGRLVALLGREELTRRLAERGTMRLRFERRDDTLINRLQELAAGATWSGEELIVAAPPVLRPRILEVIRETGATILALTTEEARLDDLYRDLVGEEHD